MSQVTREDGQNFIVPSYRDSIMAKKESLLKRELTTLSGSYGQYANLHKISGNRYEVAFSQDTGPLLGETVLDYFNNPQDLIFCEEIPGTEEAVLVIVKSGSVYVDGSYALDSIFDELVSFLTQESNFEIYIYGNVPISKDPEEGKFSFDPKSVKSFEVLKEAVFNKLPVLKKFELLPLETVLKDQKIGVFPTDKIALVLGVIGLLFGGWYIMSNLLEEDIVPIIITKTVDPYSNYKQQLQTPDPRLELDSVIRKIILLYTLPGWQATRINYENNIIDVKLQSQGARTSSLFDWAKKNSLQIDTDTTGFSLKIKMINLNRSQTSVIYRFNDVISNLVDRVSYVLPSNALRVTNINRGTYFTVADVKITFTGITPSTFKLLSNQLAAMPIVLNKVTTNLRDDKLTGSIDLKVLGN